MDKMGYPRGLIRYTTENALEGKPSRILRGRTIVYGAILAALFIGFLVALNLRSPLGIDVIRDRNALYRETVDGRIETVYTLKILNKSEEPHEVVLSVAGLPGATLETSPPDVRLEPGQVASVIAHVSVARNSSSPGGHDLIFIVTRKDDPSISARSESRFILPLR